MLIVEIVVDHFIDQSIRKKISLMLDDDGDRVLGQSIQLGIWIRC